MQISCGERRGTFSRPTRPVLTHCDPGVEGPQWVESGGSRRSHPTGALGRSRKSAGSPPRHSASPGPPRLPRVRCSSTRRCGARTTWIIPPTSRSSAGRWKSNRRRSSATGNPRTRSKPRRRTSYPDAQGETPLAVASRCTRRRQRGEGKHPMPSGPLPARRRHRLALCEVRRWRDSPGTAPGR